MQGVGGLIGTPIAAFLQKVSGKGDIVYLFAFSIFIVSGIILLPFSKPRKETRTEIEIAVSQNNFKVYTRRVEQSKNNEIVYEREMNLFEFNI
ncbi:Hypothetical predicted protein [Mytilus galloprovincialis]|uniref:Uncharacterized protein n=1 Tax=Mytilus galloprovincialis TaxID=29158 RepID=A0A8B6G1W1_MYTGA|nr:Hypothetical predicted protein [Mytilus galloprovincialis]